MNRTTSLLACLPTYLVSRALSLITDLEKLEVRKGQVV